MDDILRRIKRAILAGRYDFSDKALDELIRDGLNEFDVIESILNAKAIDKTLRSSKISRTLAREYLYIIISNNLDGLPIYTKGKFTKQHGVETYYFLISSKRAE